MEYKIIVNESQTVQTGIMHLSGFSFCIYLIIAFVCLFVAFVWLWLTFLVHDIGAKRVSKSTYRTQCILLN